MSLEKPDARVCPERGLPLPVLLVPSKRYLEIAPCMPDRSTAKRAGSRCPRRALAGRCNADEDSGRFTGFGWLPGGAEDVSMDGRALALPALRARALLAMYGLAEVGRDNGSDSDAYGRLRAVALMLALMCLGEVGREEGEVARGEVMKGGGEERNAADADLGRAVPKQEKRTRDVEG